MYLADPLLDPGDSLCIDGVLGTMVTFCRRWAGRRESRQRKHELGTRLHAYFLEDARNLIRDRSRGRAPLVSDLPARVAFEQGAHHSAFGGGETRRQLRLRARKAQDQPALVCELDETGT